MAYMKKNVSKDGSVTPIWTRIQRKLKPVGIKKYAFGMFSVLCVCFLCSTLSQARVVDRIVAVVNNDIITLTDLNKAVSPYIEKINSAGYSSEKRKEILYKIKKDMLDRMIDQKLTDQEVKRLHITVTDQEVDNAIERFKQAQSMTQEDLEKALKQSGMTLKEYRDKIHQEILRPKLINYEIKSKVIVTDQDIKKYYADHKQEFSGINKYHLCNICIPVDSNASDELKAEQYNKIEKIKKMLDQGKNFRDLAKKYSEVPNASSGGDLGTFEIGALSGKIRDAVSELTPGKYTDVILTDNGYQIFYLEDVKTENGKTFADVSAQISKKLYKEKAEKKFKSWLESLREKSHIKIML